MRLTCNDPCRPVCILFKEVDALALSYIFPPPYSLEASQEIKNHMQQPISIWKSFSTILSAMPMSPLQLLVILFHTVTTSATEFVYNTNFNPKNITLYGNATVESSILTLTNQSFFSIGRAFYPHKIPTKPANSSAILPFATSFIFSVAPIKNFVITGHGLAFIFTPSRGLNGTTSAEYLGLFNLSNGGNPQNHVFGVEFDTIRNSEEFNDISDNHVGVDINSLVSSISHEAGYWGGKDDKEFKVLKINDRENYQVWIEFMDPQLNVTMAKAGQKRPRVPLISWNVNLSGVLMDEMYVGFSAATGKIIDCTRILAWSFSNSNFSIGDALVTANLPSFVLHKGWFSGSRALLVGAISIVLIIGCGSVVLFILCRGNKADEEFEDWELEYWPHRISFHEIDAATRGFSEENVIAIGGNGKVYKGVLQGEEVAVKRILQERQEGMREFLAEVSSLGRMRQKNLVGLRGWCKKEKGNLILVYDFMSNGSLDKRVFECEENKMLGWEERIEVLKNVAAGILYLHEGWEVKVLHRDVKASNVLLDKEMNARLGDFGLARMHDHHGQVATTTRVLGTVGYIAPEVIRTGRASTQSDVFGFGILVLEVLCGRRPIEEHKPGLVEWLMSLVVTGLLHSAVDERLKAEGGYTIEEAERLLHLGLLCSNSDPSMRPTMKQVVKMLEGEMEGAESDEESMEMGLLGRIKSAAMWSRTECTFPCSSYPTLDEIKMFSFCSMMTSTSGLGSIPESSESDITREGR